MFIVPVNLILLKQIPYDLSLIEQVFSRLKKKFKIFSMPAHNATLTKDYESLQIAFALLKLFHKPILSDTSYEDIAHIMKSRVNIPNRLRIVVQEFNLFQVKSYLELEYILIMKKIINNFNFLSSQ